MGNEGVRMGAKKKWGWILVPTVAAFLFISYFLSDPVSSLIQESSWSRPIHHFVGWGNTLNNLNHAFTRNEMESLKELLNKTAFRNKTVIISTLNGAWSSRESMIDLFLKSFRIGNRTRTLLEHVVIVALDERAYIRCRDIHLYCFALKTNGVDFSREKFFMSSDYLKMMWRRIDFLRIVLELGYNFVFSDADILWFRDPFEKFSQEYDIEIACDHYTGSPTSLDNKPNGGFVHAFSNNKTIAFYKLWYASRLSYQGLHDQAVLDKIKYTGPYSVLGLRVRFLSTELFANFCEINRSRLETVYTMHANCCKGLTKKIKDLRGLISDWSKFKFLSDEERMGKGVYHWSPLECPKIK